MKYDRIIIGAGLYGLYAAAFCGARGESVLVLECDTAPFKRATYINQARVHQGYHYPRSISTAMKSAGYFERFHKDFGFCINREFDQVYATSDEYSWTNGEQFRKFCAAAGIPCEELYADKFFKPGMCDGAFLTREYTYDAAILRDFLLDKIEQMNGVRMYCGAEVSRITKMQDVFEVTLLNGRSYRTGFLLDAAYASTNQVLRMLAYEPFDIKYELCEIILCKPGKNLARYGFTVMDGPFFSIMPFGKTGMHSLTSVTFTPHADCRGPLPMFHCQKISGGGAASFVWETAMIAARSLTQLFHIWRDLHVSI